MELGSTGPQQVASVDRRRPVAGPAGAIRASKIAPGDFVARNDVAYLIEIV